MRFETFYVDVTDGLTHQALTANEDRRRIMIFTDGACYVREAPITDNTQGVVLSTYYPPFEMHDTGAVHIKAPLASGASGSASYVRFYVEYSSGE